MKYKRFFAFGCSFTRYYWPTWADIISKEFAPENYYNLGMSAVGNEFIFNKLAEAHARWKITEEDLVIICWTNFAREDRYGDAGWTPAGNIFTQKVYSAQWVKQWFNLRGALLKTSNALVGATHLLDSIGCKYVFASMVPMNQIDQFHSIFVDEKFQDIFDIYRPYYDKIIISLTDYLYGTNICTNPDPILTTHRYDDHPSPLQHLRYTQDCLAQSIVIPISDSTIKWVQSYENQIRNSQPYHLHNNNDWNLQQNWHKNMC